MKTRVFFWSMLFILCSVAGAAQNKITQETFNKLVDYANCMYVRGYMEANYRKTPDTLIQNHKNKVIDRLNQCSLNDTATIIADTVLFRLLKDNKNGKENELAQYVNKLKNNFKTDLSNCDLIYLLLPESYNEIRSINNAWKALKKELNDIYCSDKNKEAAATKTTETSGNQQTLSDPSPDNNDQLKRAIEAIKEQIYEIVLNVTSTMCKAGIEAVGASWSTIKKEFAKIEDALKLVSYIQSNTLSQKALYAANQELEKELEKAKKAKENIFTALTKKDNGYPWSEIGNMTLQIASLIIVFLIVVFFRKKIWQFFREKVWQLNKDRTVKDRIKAIKQNIQTMESEYKKNTSGNHELSEKIKTLKEECEQLKKDHPSYFSKINPIIEHLNTFLKTLNNTDSESLIENLEKAVEETKTKTEELVGQLEQNRETIDAKRLEINQSREKLNRLNNENLTSNSVLPTIEYLKIGEASMQNTIKEIDELKKKIEELKAELQKVRPYHSKTNKLKKQLNEDEDRLDSAIKVIKDLNAAIKQVNADVDGLNTEIKQLNGKIQYNQQQNTIVVNADSPVLYASSINIETMTFNAVSTESNVKTVYVLHKKGTGRAEFEVYSGAFAKVLCEHHFLVGCDLQTLGNTRVVTTQAGVAEKQDDETWKITQQARVQFE
ncbi:MAG: hypothetical protein LBD59_09500 [Prevotellaceae bacterium]|jgi:uncharacterized protein YoxC|nr:hypothetical protein [Prevotellaceae bacterium]